MYSVNMLVYVCMICGGDGVSYPFSENGRRERKPCFAIDGVPCSTASCPHQNSVGAHPHPSPPRPSSCAQCAAACHQRHRRPTCCSAGASGLGDGRCSPPRAGQRREMHAWHSRCSAAAVLAASGSAKHCLHGAGTALAEPAASSGAAEQPEPAAPSAWQPAERAASACQARAAHYWLSPPVHQCCSG